ncbi:MAG: hypothetical protein ACOCZ5_00035 [bacterium]
MSFITDMTLRDSPSLDSFGRLRTSTAHSLLDSQLTYDLQPLLWNQIISGSGAEITHDSTNRMAVLSFDSTPTGGESIMQTFEYFRYSAGKSQLAFISFNFRGSNSNTLKFVGLSDGTNGIEFQNDGTNNKITILSTTNSGNNEIIQDDWNLDVMDGTGPSGINLDISKTNIFVVDFQALYVGRVRVGFDIGGKIIYVHEFVHANELEVPYFNTANLPVRCGMTCSDTSTTSMNLICTTVISESAEVSPEGFYFSVEGEVTASTDRTHILSLQPKLLFNGITNRSKFVLESVNIMNTGNNNVRWELCIGTELTGDTTFNDVNTDYSTIEYNVNGTAEDPGIVIASGYITSTNQSKGQINNMGIPFKYPITLDSDGEHRLLGRLTLLVSTTNSTSNCLASINWKEIR